MTKEIAEYLAAGISGYIARKMHARRADGTMLPAQWCVWCAQSAHVVEFDQSTIDNAAAAIAAERG